MYTTMKDARRCIYFSTKPVEFINEFCWINSPILGETPLSLNDEQLQLIDYFQHLSMVDYSGARQTGKSTVIAAFSLWEAIFNPQQRIAIASGNKTQADYALSRVSYMYDRLPNEPWIPKMVSNTKNGKEFEGESSIQIFKRGSVYDHIFFEEYAHYTPKTKEIADNYMAQSNQHTKISIVNSIESDVS
jgi:hypothetical protein